MKITSAAFEIGVVNLRQLPKHSRQEIAFLGRSNVGKSSLINKLSSRRALARSSSEPGKTRELNYYFINNKFYFVDLPGYGYARIPDQVRSSWGTLIEQYLKNRSQLSLVVQLVDARHEPTELDMMMVGWLDYYEIPFVVVLTKSDKLPRSKMPLRVNAARACFAAHRHCREVIPFSAITGTGKTELLHHIGLVIGNGQEKTGATKAALSKVSAL